MSTATVPWPSVPIGVYSNSYGHLEVSTGVSTAASDWRVVVSSDGTRQSDLYPDIRCTKVLWVETDERMGVRPFTA